MWKNSVRGRFPWIHNYTTAKEYINLVVVVFSSVLFRLVLWWEALQFYCLFIKQLVLFSFFFFIFYCFIYDDKLNPIIAFTVSTEKKIWIACPSGHCGVYDMLNTCAEAYAKLCSIYLFFGSFLCCQLVRFHSIKGNWNL